MKEEKFNGLNGFRSLTEEELLETTGGRALPIFYGPTIDGSAFITEFGASIPTSDHAVK